MQELEKEQDQFSILEAYPNYFTQATNFSLSFLRFTPRGYDRRLNRLTWNGLALEDWENGSVSWNVTGNLSAMNTSNRSDRIVTSAGGARQGGKIGTSISNRTYSYKTSASYNLDTGRGRKATIDLMRRSGNSLSIEGISADSYSIFASGFTTLGTGSIELSLLFAPTTRTTQRASTNEGYSLAGQNLYNSAWGWQGSTKRNPRQNESRQPIAMLNHRTHLGTHARLLTTLGARVGTESRSGLSWQNTPNPYPDYCRYMPSYQTDADAQQMIREAWQGDQSVSQINFQNLYNINLHNTPQAKYIVEKRIRNVQQYTLMSQIEIEQGLSGGVELTYAQNRNYKQVEDLMGAKYWLDTDSFVENDDDIKDQVQNNIRNPNFHATEGDRFGYDYTMTLSRFKLWADAERKWGQIGAKLRTEIATIRYQRQGHFEKENFSQGASYGKSPMITNYDYDIQAAGWYAQGGRLKTSLALGYRSVAPDPSQLFISREYRNATLHQSISEKIGTAELTFDYRTPGFRINAAAYYTLVTDRTQLLNFYDDNLYQYTHYWIRGIEQRYVGLELSSQFDLAENLTANIAIALSDNRYTANPRATQWSETKGEQIRENETVYYENLHTSGSPQNVAVAGINYTPLGYRFSVSVNYFDNNYISITPLRRTERSSAQMTMTNQEKLSSGATFDLFCGKTFYINRSRQALGIWIGANNILNNRDIRSSGYE